MTIANVWRSLQGQARRWLPPKGGSDPVAGKGANRAKVAALLAVSLFGAQQAAAQTCQPSKLYDIVSSAFHQSVAQRNNGTWAGWGEDMANGSVNGNNPAIKPQDLDKTNYAGLGDNAVLLATTASASTTEQTVVLTTDGLYAWGDRDTVIAAALTPTSSKPAQKVVVSGSAYGLPSGIAPADVDQLFAISSLLAIVTKNGSAYVLNKSNANLSGDGSSPIDTAWHQVKDESDAPLTGVIGLRGHVQTATRGAMMALTSNGNVYAWGTNVYLGNGASATNKTKAALVNLSTAAAAAGTGAKPKMIGVTGGRNANNAFFVLYDSGHLFAMGANNLKQLGDRTTTDRTDWVAVKRPDGSAFDDVRFISVQEHDTGASNGGPAGVLITNTNGLYTWGNNDQYDMLDQPSCKNGTCDPGIPVHFTANSHQARYAEMGGHTMVYLARGSAKFCYVGHRTNGSMGDDGKAQDNPDGSSYNCTETPALNICGSTAIDAKDDTYPALPVPDAPVTLADLVFKNDELAEAPLYESGAYVSSLINRLTLTVDTPATPINWGPVPVLETNSASADYGKVTVPAGTAPGNYVITYKICETAYVNEICDTANVNVTVLGIKAIPDTATTTPNNPVITKVTGNDTSPSGTPIDENTVTVVSQPPNGNVVCKGDAGGGSLNAGECKYTPKPGFKGTDTYTYKVCNTASSVECDTTTVTVGVGEPPAIAAYPDADVTTPGVPVTTPVLANDVAVGGTLDPASVALVGTPTGPGAATVTCATGYCTLTSSTPGTYTYNYKVCMASPNDSTCTTSTVTVLVTADASTPGITAAPDFDSTPKNTPVTTTVLYNDKAVGGTINPGSVSVTANPGHGNTLVDSVTGKITYTPANNFVGTDTYTYQVCLITPSTTCTTTTVTVKVGDPAITAKDDSAQVPTGGGSVTTPVLDNDEPVGGELDQASVTIITPPGKGTAVPNPDGTVTYTPGGGFDGTDEYTYRVCLKNPKEACSTAKVSISDAKPDVYATIQMPGSANSGDQVTALLTFGNSGKSVAEGVTYKVTGLPQGLGTVSCGATATCTYDSTTGTVTITGLPTALAPGQKQQVELRWTVPNNQSATTYTLTTEVTTTTSGDSTGNNTDTAALQVPKTPQPPKSIPVDNPLALLVAALGIMGLMARQGRRARR